MFQVVLNGERYCLVFTVQVHDGRERKGELCGFLFPWPVHHSYIIQEEDTCIHSAGAQWKGGKGGLICSDWISIPLACVQFITS